MPPAMSYSRRSIAVVTSTEPLSTVEISKRAAAICDRLHAANRYELTLANGRQHKLARSWFVDKDISIVTNYHEDMSVTYLVAIAYVIVPIEPA